MRRTGNFLQSSLWPKQAHALHGEASMDKRGAKSPPIKSVHALVTIGSKTVRGGKVVTSSSLARIGGLGVALVGDWVEYADGSRSPITSGAGAGWVEGGRPLAIVGSHIENGDVIETSTQDAAKILQFSDRQPIPGLLEASYKPS